MQEKLWMIFRLTVYTNKTSRAWRTIITGGWIKKILSWKTSCSWGGIRLYSILKRPRCYLGCLRYKDKGTDFESLPIAYQFGEDFYIPDVVFDDETNYEILDNKTAAILIRHQPHKVRFESNQAGGRIADNISKMIKGKARTIIEPKYTTANKETKILVNSDWIKKHCLF